MNKNIMKHISKQAFSFLHEIKQNNNREWFLENKPRYLIIKQELELFAAHWFWELNRFDLSLQTYGEKPYLFRIHRDARFAKGKKYKEHYSILIVQWGKPAMHQRAGYFLHIEPGNSFLVGWAFHPEAPWLKNIRNNIVEHSKELSDILDDEIYKKNFILSGDRLKTAPRWFTKDHPQIEFLRYKSLYMIHHFSDTQLLGKNFLGTLVEKSQILFPFNSYINSMK